MRDERCDCLACQAYRLAIYLAFAGLLILVGVCAHFLSKRVSGSQGARIERSL